VAAALGAAAFGSAPVRATPVAPVNTADRAAVIALYNSVHANTVSASGWTGSLATCTPGTTSAAFREQAYTETNYYRALGGVPSGVTENATYQAQAQAAALTYPLSPSGNDPHNPLPSYPCFTAAGLTGAQNSNFYGWCCSLPGSNSRDAIRSWMDDGLGDMGHRYGILNPPATQTGFGYVPSDGGWGAAYQYAQDQPFTAWPAMNTPGGALVWPPSGFVPRQDVFRAWSIWLPGADMTNAVVTTTKDGAPIASPVIFRETKNTPGHSYYPPSVLVWQPNMPLDGGGSYHAASAADVIYQVTITGIPGHDPLTYTVKVVSPELSTVPTAPTAMQLTNSGANVSMSWTDNSNNETTFDIERARWVAGVWTEWTGLPSAGANATSASDNNVPAGQYAYLVRAHNATGDSPWLIGVVFHSSATTIPAAPTSLQLANSGSNVTVAWADNATNELGYDVMRARWVAGVWSEWTSWPVDINGTSFTDTNAPDGTYAYLVRAQNPIGPSAWLIAVIDHSTATTPPAAPTGLQLVSTGPGVKLTWTDNATNELVYDVQRAHFVGGVWTEWNAWPADINATSFTDPSVPSGTYAYLVRARNPIAASAWVINVITRP